MLRLPSALLPLKCSLCCYAVSAAADIIKQVRVARQELPWEAVVTRDFNGAMSTAPADMISLLWSMLQVLPPDTARQVRVTQQRLPCEAVVTRDFNGAMSTAPADMISLLWSVLRVLRPDTVKQVRVTRQGADMNFTATLCSVGATA